MAGHGFLRATSVCSTDIGATIAGGVGLLPTPQGFNQPTIFDTFGGMLSGHLPEHHLAGIRPVPRRLTEIAMRLQRLVSICCSDSFTVFHSLSMMENTTMSRTVPSRHRSWLRSTPSCLAPSRATAAREAWLCQWVLNSTAMQSRDSKAWVSWSSFASVLMAVRWALLANQVEPISSRRLSALIFAECRHPANNPGIVPADGPRHHGPSPLERLPFVNLSHHLIGGRNARWNHVFQI
jgi:hypothetical protein